MTFWTRVDTMSGWNGGKIEASADGTTWTKLNVTPNYNGTKIFDEPCMAQSEPCFTGALTTWTQETADFSGFNHNGNVKVRFTWAVRWTGTGNGWWVDDVQMSWGGSCTTQTTSVPGKVLNNLTVAKSGTNLNLNWSDPLSPCTVTGYGLYRGTLPWSGYNHASVNCTITSTSTSTPQQSGSNYYLIVPLNSSASREGSYGTSSSGSERPQGSSPCNTQDLTSCN
jgi:hypothetical protein